VVLSEILCIPNSFKLWACKKKRVGGRRVDNKVLEAGFLNFHQNCIKCSHTSFSGH